MFRCTVYVTSKNLNKKRIYIALLLILVFTLPVLYQSWHNIHHHLDELPSNVHHQCHLEAKTCQPAESKGYANALDTEHCIIMEYEFSIQDLPANLAGCTDDISFHIHYRNYPHPGYSNFYKSSKSPRAPPGIFFTYHA